MRFPMLQALLVLALSGHGAVTSATTPHSSPAEAIRVEAFSPQGTVKPIRQVTARFSAPMLRLGDALGPQPFRIDCPVAGRGHWLDSRNWIYDFATDLPAGLRCSFTVEPSLSSLGGRLLSGNRAFTFDTGGPGIIDSLPGEGHGGIDADQSFILALDAAATGESIAAHTHCEVEGVGERIETQLLTGTARDTLLTSKLRQEYRYFFDRFPDAKALQERLVALQCRRRLPPDTPVRLVWGKGIEAVGSGLATTEARTLEFRTRPSFTARFECERVNAQAQCVPFLPMKLFFSASLPAEQAAAIRLVAQADGRTFSPEAFETGKATIDHVVFKGPFPEASKFEIRLGADLTDDAGRPLENAARFPLPVATDEYPPLAKFSGEFGIIESNEGGILPVTLRNVEDTVAAELLGPEATRGAALSGQLQRVDDDDARIIGWLKTVKTAAERRGEWVGTGTDKPPHWKELTGSTSVFAGTAGTTPLSITKPLGGGSFEVIGIPLPTPGFYVVELASPRLGAALLGVPRPRYVATSALVTNLAVHFKWGRESSRVWVTTLDRATPVANAAIRISDYCKGTVIWNGTTDAAGLATIGGATLPPPNDDRDCGDWNASRPPLFVSARVDGQLGFTFSGWNRGIQPSDFGLMTGSAEQARVAHAVLDRSLLRSGETVSMKLLLREKVMNGFAVPAGTQPNQLRITHSGSNQEYPLPVAFDARGIAEASWTIPREAKLGAYDLRLYRDDQWLADAGQFQVQQFRVPTMRAVIQSGAEPLVNASSATVDLFVSYLSGGGAGGLPVVLRTQVRPRPLTFPAYEDFSFGGTDVAEGLIEETDEAPDTVTAPARTLPLTLNGNGSARTTLTDLPTAQTPQELLAELEYPDANGERLTVAQRIPLWPAKLNLGLRTENWAVSRDRLQFQVVALGLDGKPLAGQAIQVELFAKKTFSYRKRLIGGFYAYENRSELRRLPARCDVRTDRLGLASCEVPPASSGAVVLRASARDDRGNMALATREVWVATGDDWWFEGGPSDRMDVLPERAAYEAGDTARIQVRSPFREATALVTIEREGVLDAFVTELSGKSPVIEIPIKPQYAPNAFVSVLAVRGRAAEPLGWLHELGRKLHLTKDREKLTATVDLDKPAYRLGTRSIDIGWKPYRLDVKVMPERETYKVRERARIKVAVNRADAGPLPESAEIAFAAVDEGLLELKPNRSWQLLDAMMGRRGIEVFTSTAQMQVVGKRHYGRKAVPHGGGGGRQPARELFDTLLLWRGRVPLDAGGQAEVEVPLNDSITGFRLTAVADGGTGYFGTGSATIRATQDLALTSGLPPLVREGDDVVAIFTARNTSNRAVTADVSASVSAQSGRPTVPALAPQSLTLKPGEAQELRWAMTVPTDTAQLTWDITASERDGGDARDNLRLAQTVIPALPVRVQQATLVQLTQAVRIETARPPDAVPGAGGVRVELREWLGDGGDGVREYMQSYPYTCLEQRISRAVALRDRGLWDSMMAELPSYTDGDGLFQYFPGDRLEGSDTLTAYLLAMADESGWPLPEASRNRAIAALQGFVEGRLSRLVAPFATDRVVRRLTAIEALARHGQARPSMLDALTIEPALWPTSAILDWLGILQRLPTLAGRDARLQEAAQTLRSRLSFRGTTAGFSTERSDGLPWLMAGTDANLARLILAVSGRIDWRSDLPRLVTGALGRQRKGHWDTTVANAWGTLALEKFAAAFRGGTVSGVTQVKLAEQQASWHFGPDSTRGTVDLPWPTQPAALELEHQGSGTPWATIQSRAAVPLRADDFNGYAIHRTLLPVEQRQAGIWSRGDVARVRLELEAQADMAWVVVDDPIPSGASILGTGLGRDSSLLTADERQDGGAWPLYQERRFDAFRSYYDYVPKGRWTVEYTVRFNNPGRFALPPTRVEALYAPEVFGESPNGTLEVKEP
ncbi:alpha-2-macroglobulin family protein [Methylolobus aquaticus]